MPLRHKSNMVACAICSSRHTLSLKAALYNLSFLREYIYTNKVGAAALRTTTQKKKSLHIVPGCWTRHHFSLLLPFLSRAWVLYSSFTRAPLSLSFVCVCKAYNPEKKKEGMSELGSSSSSGRSALYTCRLHSSSRAETKKNTDSTLRTVGPRVWQIFGNVGIFFWYRRGLSFFPPKKKNCFFFSLFLYEGRPLTCVNTKGVHLQVCRVCIGRPKRPTGRGPKRDQKKTWFPIGELEGGLWATSVASRVILDMTQHSRNRMLPHHHPRRFLLLLLWLETNNDMAFHTQYCCCWAAAVCERAQLTLLNASPVSIGKSLLI